MICIDKLTATLSRDSTEVRTPVFSDEGLALCDLPSPTDVLDPIDYRTVCRTVRDPTSKEIPSPGRRSNHANDAYPPIRSLVIAGSPLSPSGYSINGVSSTNTCEQNVVASYAISLPNEEDPIFSDPLSTPPKRKRESRRTSLVFRPASSGGPAMQTLSPPPVKVSLALRRGIAPPSRLPPAPPSRTRSRQSIGQSQQPYGSAHNASEPGTPASLTAEEGLIQLQVRTQQTDSNTRLRYRRSFSHIRGLNPRTHPTSVLPQVSSTINTYPDGSDDVKNRSRSKGLLIGSNSESSSDESGPLSTPPDDAIPDITITRSGEGNNAPSDHLHFSERARAGKYASSFLDFEPGTPLSPPSPLSPATQSPFSVAQSQLLTYCDRCSLSSVEASSEQSDLDNCDEQEQRDWGARRGEDPIQSPGINLISTRGSKTEPGPSCLNRPYIYHSSDAKMGGGGIAGAYHTRVVGQSQRRPKSGVRRSHRPRSKNGTTATRKSRDRASCGIYSVTRGVVIRPEIISRITTKGRSPSRVA